MFYNKAFYAIILDSVFSTAMYILHRGLRYTTISIVGSSGGMK